jgi:hypothetical protein
MGVFEVLAVISIRTAGTRGILLEAIDDRLRNGRLICRHVRGKVRIRDVEQQEIYQIDRGGYGWRVDFMRGLVTSGSLRVLNGDRTRAEGNRNGKGYG